MDLITYPCPHITWTLFADVEQATFSHDPIHAFHWYRNYHIVSIILKPTDSANFLIYLAAPYMLLKDVSITYDIGAVDK